MDSTQELMDALEQINAVIQNGDFENPTDFAILEEYQEYIERLLEEERLRGEAHEGQSDTTA